MEVKIYFTDGQRIPCIVGDVDMSVREVNGEKKGGKMSFWKQKENKVETTFSTTSYLSPPPYYLTPLISSDDNTDIQPHPVFYQWVQWVGEAPGEAPAQIKNETLSALKNAIHTIKEEAVSEEVQKSITARIERYKKVGATLLAQVLENELKARIKLARIKEWDYKVLPYEAIKKYDNKIVNGYYMRVHIDPLERYCGSPSFSPNGTIIDKNAVKFIPDEVLTKLEEAQSRQIFDEYYVLWIEKVKDPLLLGKIKELPDYFLIAEWGEDVKFEDFFKKEK